MCFSRKWQIVNASPVALPIQRPIKRFLWRDQLSVFEIRIMRAIVRTRFSHALFDESEFFLIVTKTIIASMIFVAKRIDYWLHLDNIASKLVAVNLLLNIFGWKMSLTFHARTDDISQRVKRLNFFLLFVPPSLSLFSQFNGVRIFAFYTTANQTDLKWRRDFVVLADIVQ